MEKYPITELQPKTYFTDNVYLDDKYILLNPDTPFSQELKQRLTDWKYQYVYSNGSPQGTPVQPSVEESESQEGDGSSALLDNHIKEREQLEEAKQFFSSFIELIEKSFESFISDGNLNINEISNHTKQAIQIIKSHKRFILRFPDMPIHKIQYVYPHTARSTLLALAIGDILHMPQHKLIDLGNACILHEIGMMKLPPKLYLTPKKLSSNEFKSITTHTVLGYQLLKNHSVSLSVALPALEHHERVDGTGYPRKLTKEKISLYGRIISVVCAYDAMISRRPYREGMNGNSAILELLKFRGKYYDEQVVNALVMNLSLYPLGHIVKLKNGSIGIVVDAQSDKPKNPRIRILINEVGTRQHDAPLVIAGDSEPHQVTGILNSRERLQVLKQFQQ